MNTVQKQMEYYLAKIEEQKSEMRKRVMGMESFLESLLICFYSHSERKLVPHLLVEGRVGQGKTTTLDTFAKTIDGATFKRIQFTPDLRPLDLIRIVRQRPDRTLEFQPGPLLSNIVLADEVNRAHEKTRSALLEAMGEEQITLEGETIALERPFFVMATENPIETEGVYQLGAAQLDRFMMKTYTEVLSEDEEMAIAGAHQEKSQEITPVLTKNEVLEMREFIREHVFVCEAVRRYGIRICRALRPDGGILSAEETYFLPEGERAHLFLERGAKVKAFLEGRSYVLPEDIDAVAFRVLNHRIGLKYGGGPKEIATYVAKALKEVRDNELAEARRSS